MVDQEEPRITLPLPLTAEEGTGTGKWVAKGSWLRCWAWPRLSSFQGGAIRFPLELEEKGEP